MASFSSRGPVGNDFLKPDVTAPGVSILAGHSPEHMPPDLASALGPQGQLFQASPAPRCPARTPPASRRS